VKERSQGAASLSDFTSIREMLKRDKDIQKEEE
jgi:hypothetical protein